MTNYYRLVDFEDKDLLWFLQHPYTEDSLVSAKQQFPDDNNIYNNQPTEMKIWLKSLKKAIENIRLLRHDWGNHYHMHSMAHQIRKLFVAYRSEVETRASWVAKGVIDLVVRQVVQNLDTFWKRFEPIYEILGHDNPHLFTHREKQLLLRPYWYDFEFYALDNFDFDPAFDELYGVVKAEYIRRLEWQIQLPKLQEEPVEETNQEIPNEE